MPYKRNNHGRIQGRRGVAIRTARLQREPLCRDCKAKGIYTEAVTPDHIVPLALGGTDTDDNIQCLCGPCHDRKTAKDLGYTEKKTFGLDGWPL